MSMAKWDGQILTLQPLGYFSGLKTMEPPEWSTVEFLKDREKPYKRPLVS